MIAKRIVIVDTARLTKDQTDAVLCAVTVPVVRINPLAARAGPAAYSDMLLAPDTPLPVETRFYEAVMGDDGKVTVLKDTFSPGEFTHTFAGWPVPGYPL